MSGPAGSALPSGPQQRAAPPSVPGWRERWQAWRDARLIDPAFRAWAQRFGPTRWVVRRRSAQLFDVMSGFVYSQVLAACVELDLFERVARRPQPLTDLSRDTGLDEDALRRLLEAAVSLELLQRRGPDRYGLGPLGAPMVGDEAIVAMVRHHAVLYADLRDPVGLLRRRGAPSAGDAAASTGAPTAEHPAAPSMSRYWPYADGVEPGRLSDAQVAEYSALMSASQPLVAEQVVAVAPWSRHRHLVDIGGGEGRFALQVAAAAPHLAITVFDLPAVAARAEARVRAAGLGERIHTCGGDFLRDPLPSGADLISLVRVLFDHPDARCVQLLRRIHAALPPGGAVLIAEPMAGVAGTERMGDAYYPFYLLAMGHGRSRSPAQHAALLHEAGFAPPRCLRTPVPLQASVLIAHKA